MAEALSDRGWPIDRASLRLIDFDEGNAVLVGLWTRLHTSVVPGTRFPITSTAYPLILASGHAVRRGKDPYPPLLDQILEREGLQSWITIPLRDGPSIAALLSLASLVPDAFPRDGRPFFEDLGTKLQESLLSLIRAETAPPADDTERRG